MSATFQPQLPGCCVLIAGMARSYRHCCAVGVITRNAATHSLKQGLFAWTYLYESTNRNRPKLP